MQVQSACTLNCKVAFSNEKHGKIDKLTLEFNVFLLVSPVAGAERAIEAFLLLLKTSRLFIFRLCFSKLSTLYNRIFGTHDKTM